VNERRFAGTSIVHPTFGWHMDDKSLHLWRQIEAWRRTKKLAKRGALPETQLARAAANDPV